MASDLASIEGQCGLLPAIRILVSSCGPRSLTVRRIVHRIARSNGLVPRQSSKLIWSNERLSCRVARVSASEKSVFCRTLGVFALRRICSSFRIFPSRGTLKAGAFLVVLAYVALYFYASVRVSRWLCPECKRAFCSVFRNRGEFDTKC